MPRYKLTVAYDGSDFCGWQKQEPLDPGAGAEGQREGAALRQARAEKLVAGAEGRIALRTVQAVLERAVREVVREPVVLTGASRTDSGVHAWGQVAAFTCEPSGEGSIALPGDAAPADAGAHGSGERSQTQGAHIGQKTDATGSARGGRGGGWPASRGTDTLVRAVNSRLPDDVLVRSAEIVADDFDPIAGATSKAYSYTFHCSLDRPLWDRRLVCHTRHELDLSAMQAAAAALVGEHDFAAFAAAGHGRRSTVRMIDTCEVVELARADGGARRIRLDVSGNGFLYNMVRIIAGTLHEAGRGRLAPEAIADIIASGDRRRAGPTMPPDGLRLEWVRYDR